MNFFGFEKHIYRKWKKELKFWPKRCPMARLSGPNFLLGAQQSAIISLFFLFAKKKFTPQNNVVLGRCQRKKITWASPRASAGLRDTGLKPHTTLVLARTSFSLPHFLACGPSVACALRNKSRPHQKLFHRLPNYF